MIPKTTLTNMSSKSRSKETAVPRALTRHQIHWNKPNLPRHHHISTNSTSKNLLNHFQNPLNPSKTSISPSCSQKSTTSHKTTEKTSSNSFSLICAFNSTKNLAMTTKSWPQYISSCRNSSKWAKEKKASKLISTSSKITSRDFVGMSSEPIKKH